MNKVILMLACWACAAVAQTTPPAPAPLSNEQVLELQLLQSQRAEIAAPFQAIQAELKDIGERLKALQAAALAPLDRRQGTLSLSLCQLAGLTEADVRAEKCVVDLDAKTVGRAPDAPPAKK